MKKINNIISNRKFLDYMKKTAKWEWEREFCRHDMVHLTDVARIAMIINLQDGYGLDREMIYAAALLHDIGRWQQYETGEDHALVSAGLAPAILAECGFSKEDSEQIVSAISTHRDSGVKDEKNLKGLLYRADKLSRPCYFCEQEKNCNWKNEKKNKTLEI